MPRFTTPVIIKRAYDGPSARIGNQRTGSNIARVVKRLDTTIKANVVKPTATPPPTHETAPGVYAVGWQAWWPAPPTTSTNPYKIPDPPTIPRPVMPNSTNPILWEAFAEVGSAASLWDVRISAFYALVEWVPQTGSQKMAGARDLSISEAALKIRPSILTTAGVNPKEWDVMRVDDNSTWKFEATVPSFRRGEFIEMMVERIG